MITNTSISKATSSPRTDNAELEAGTSRPADSEPPPAYVPPATEPLLRRDFYSDNANQDATRRSLTRFLLALLIALGILSLVGTITGVSVGLTRPRHGHWVVKEEEWFREEQRRLSETTCSTKWDAPLDLPGERRRPHQHIQATNLPNNFPPALPALPLPIFPDLSIARPAYHSSTSFIIPRNTPQVFVHSRGASSGNITVVTDPSIQDVVIEVEVFYDSPDLLSIVRVCPVQEEDREGLMIYSSVLPRGNVKKLPVFAVLARLPLGKLEEYNEEGLAHSGTFDFETDMPFFTHTIGPLLNDVTFRSLSLSTIEAPIHVESIYAERASIVTSNAPITGTFKSSKSLRLATQKAPIIINAILEGGASSPTALDVQTHQAPLAIATTLESPGSFSITSRTYNAPIQLTFPQSSSNVPDFHPSFVEAAPSNLRFDFTLHKSSSDVGPASFSGGSNAPDDDSNPGIGAHFSFNLKDGSKVDGMMAW